MRFVCILVLLTGGLAAEDVSDPRAEVLNRVRALAGEFDRFEDEAVAAEALTQLGSVTCRYDQPTAAGVFRFAASALTATELKPKPYEQLRARIARSAAGCDKSLIEPLLAATLSDKVSPAQAALSAVTAAISQIRANPAHAVDIARPALAATRLMDNDEARRIQMFLSRLRTEDAITADALYLETLSTLAANPDGSLAALQALGNYAFGPLGPHEDMTSVTSVGGMAVVDLSRQRGGIPNEIASAYLNTASQILSAPVSSPGDQAYRYALARQLNAQAGSLAPELATSFQGLMEQSGAALPADMKAQAAERLGKMREQRRTESSNPGTGDAALLMKSTRHWRAGEFDEALAAAAEVKDGDARMRLDRLAHLGKAIRLANEGDATAAAAMAAQLEPALYRALAFLCLSARQFHDDQLLEDAVSSLAVAKVEAEKLDVKAKPFITLAAAKLEILLNPESALNTIGVAVTAFNELDEQPEESTPKPGEPRKSRTIVRGSGVTESLNAERSYSSVPIRLNRVDGYSFAKALPAFADADAERLEAILANLRGEGRLAEAKCAAIELRLARAIGGRPESE